jgi:hypothetical protein
MALFMLMAEEQGMSGDELQRYAEFQRNRQDPKRQLNPQIAEKVTLRIKVAPDAKLGTRELRLVAWGRLTNPVLFRVGQWPEVCELSGESDRTWEELVGLRRGRNTAPTGLPELQRITLPSVVNGQILPGEVDQFRFVALKGQQVVVAVDARSLIPYLADAVPGWFQATLALRDTDGKEVAYADDFRFQPDPILCYRIPKDGTYTVQIQDSIYRGREDFVYRIEIGELPFITGLFPLGGRTGKVSQVSLSGWNLPVQSLAVRPDSRSSEQVQVSVTNETSRSNGARFAVGTNVESREREPNNVILDAQGLATPRVVNGRIREPGDWDVFRLEGRSGDTFVAEVFARRLDSPLDSILKLTDSEGQELVSNDDHQDPGAGLTTHHSDSRIQFRLPDDGAYYLHLGDTQGKGGPAYAYRLYAGPPRPDFELRVVPSSVNLRSGASAPLEIHVLRRDGFTNEITLALKNAPAGINLAGVRLRGETNRFRVALKASPQARKQRSSLRIEGRASVGGKQVVRQAVPADDLMQAFIYHHLVPAQEMKVAVTGRAASRKSSQKAKQPAKPVSKPVAVQ